MATFPGWPRVYHKGHWIDVSPGWVLVRLQEGLTPEICEIIALAADDIGLTFADIYHWGIAMLLPEGGAE